MCVTGRRVAALCSPLPALTAAQGTHNVAGAVDQSFYKHEKYFDAHLTLLGWQQGSSLKAHLEQQERPLTASLELVVVSPLTRAVETAVAAFGGACPAAEGEPLLMVAQAEVEGLRVSRPAVSAVGVPPFVVCELCREHLGVHPCDRRRSLSAYKAAYPALDWSHVQSEEVRRASPPPPPPLTPPQDDLWEADRRETDEELALRASHFLRWLMLRPEQHIAVVTHSSCATGGAARRAAAAHSLRQRAGLDVLFRSFTGPCSPAAGDRLKTWFKNAEVRQRDAR